MQVCEVRVPPTRTVRDLGVQLKPTCRLQAMLDNSSVDASASYGELRVVHVVVVSCLDKRLPQVFQ